MPLSEIGRGRREKGWKRERKIMARQMGSGSNSGSISFIDNSQDPVSVEKGVDGGGREELKSLLDMVTCKAIQYKDKKYWS